MSKDIRTNVKTLCVKLKKREIDDEGFKKGIRALIEMYGPTCKSGIGMSLHGNIPTEVQERAVELCRDVDPKIMKAYKGWEKAAFTNNPEEGYSVDEILKS